MAQNIQKHGQYQSAENIIQSHAQSTQRAYPNDLGPPTGTIPPPQMTQIQTQPALTKKAATPSHPNANMFHGSANQNQTSLIAQQQLNQKKLLKSYQIMKGKQGATNLLVAGANGGSGAGSNQTQIVPKKGQVGGGPALTQKRISGSQLQIQAAITSKLASQQQKRSQREHYQQQLDKTKPGSTLNQSQNQIQHTSRARGSYKGLAVQQQATSFQQLSARKGTAQKVQATKKQSLNTELAALCGTKDASADLRQVSDNSATKAKSGGVRQTTFAAGFVGTPSASQRVMTQTSALSNKKPQYVGRYITHPLSVTQQLQEIVGRGAFGRVYKALCTETHEIVAIKMVPLIRLKTDYKKSIIDEIDLMRHLDHRNIVKYIETVQSGHQLCIVLEFIEGGSLEYLYKKFGCFSETLVAVYIKQVLKGLEYLHRQTVIHRDIKGGNILTTKDGVVKLADFGVATKMTDAEKNNSFAGTPHWMAPEVIEMSGVLTSASDIWSVGCTVIELLKGSPPNYDLNKFCAMIKNVREPMPIPEGASPELTDFLQKCFAKDPSKRPSASELLEHTWFAQIEKNKLARLLEKHKLPQEVTNTIKVHLDSQEEDNTKQVASDAQKTNAQNLAKVQERPIKSVTSATTQQKVKSVAQLLTRQNLNLQGNSQPSLQVKNNSSGHTKTDSGKEASQPQVVIVHSKSPLGHNAQGRTGLSTAVNLKKAIQDKLNAQALKSAKGQGPYHNQTSQQLSQQQSNLATKNHAAQIKVINAPPSQREQEARDLSKRATSANGLNQKAVIPQTKFHPAQHPLADEQHQAFFAGQKPHQQPSDHRPLTSHGLAKSTQPSAAGMTVAPRNIKTSAGIQASFLSVEGGGEGASGLVASSSNVRGSHTTTAAQQHKASGGALFDLRGNKRLFHLSRKMVGNAQQQATTGTQESKSVGPAPRLDTSHQPSTTHTVIPPSQLITEYSPEQDHLRRQQMGAPPSSATALHTHQQDSETQDLLQHPQESTAEKHNVWSGSGGVGGDKYSKPASSSNNYFKQWTEQTELTANVINGSSAGQQVLSPQAHAHQVEGKETGQDVGEEEPNQELAHEDSVEESPSHKRTEPTCKPNFPVKIHSQASTSQSQAAQRHNQKSLILEPHQIATEMPSVSHQVGAGAGATSRNNSKQRLLFNKSAEMVDMRHLQQSATATGVGHMRGHTGKVTATHRGDGVTQDEEEAQKYHSRKGLQHQVSNPAVLTNHQLAAEDQQPLSFTDEKHQHNMQRQNPAQERQTQQPRLATMSSLSQNYPTTTQFKQQRTLEDRDLHALTAPGQHETSQDSIPRNHEGTNAPHRGIAHFHHATALDATHSITNVFPAAHSTMSQHHVMLTAKASEKQARLRSPLGGFFQGQQQSNQGLKHGLGVDYSHTIDVDKKRGFVAAGFGAPQNASSLQGPGGQNQNDSEQRDESDLGDLDDEDDRRTLFHQFVTRTNLGLNRKPSNTTSLSGTTALAQRQQPQTHGSNSYWGGAALLTDTTTYGNHLQEPSTASQPVGAQQTTILSKPHKNNVRKAFEAASKQVSLIKKKLFYLDTVDEGSHTLIQAVLQSQHCECSQLDEDGEDHQYAPSKSARLISGFESDEDYESQSKLEEAAARVVKHSPNCDQSELSKTHTVLQWELCALIKDVSSGSVWPLSQAHQSVLSNEIDSAFQQASDAFKETFVSQIGCSELVDLLERSEEAAQVEDSLRYCVLQLINQLAESNLRIQRQLFSVGLVQKLVDFSQRDQPREVKVEVAYFVGQIFQHSKELISTYLSCQGYKVQLEFLRLSDETVFAGNLDLVMMAVSSVLLLFEESLSRKDQSEKRKLMQGGALSDSDLARLLTKAGFLKPLALQVASFVRLEISQSNTEASVDGGSPQTTGSMHVDRIIDILINFALCGQHKVRQELCSAPIMGEILSRLMFDLLSNSQVKDSVKMHIFKWFVKLVIALTLMHQGNSESVLAASSQLVIFELLGQARVVALLSLLVSLFVRSHTCTNQQQEGTSSYLATLYETLKLLFLLAKMSPQRCEQACQEGQLITGLHNLLSYIQALDEESTTGTPSKQTLPSVSRSKRNRLASAALQLLYELVLASTQTRTALLDHGIPALLLQLFHLKAQSQAKALHQPNQRSYGGAQSFSLQSANSHLRQASGGSGALTSAQAAQEQEIVGKVLDIFVMWVQQDDQTGQVIQEILADQQSLQVIFGLISQPRRLKAAALLSFFNSLNRILLASDRVIEALLGHVDLIGNLVALLSFLTGRLSITSTQQTSVERLRQGFIDAANLQQAASQAHSITLRRTGGMGGRSTSPQAVSGQTGATPLNTKHQKQGENGGTQVATEVSRLALQWLDCYLQQQSESSLGHEENKSRERLRSRERQHLGQVDFAGISSQQATQILKELLEIFQLLIQAQIQRTCNLATNGSPLTSQATFVDLLDLTSALRKVEEVARSTNLIILQSMADHLLIQMAENGLATSLRQESPPEIVVAAKKQPQQSQHMFRNIGSSNQVGGGAQTSATFLQKGRVQQQNSKSMFAAQVQAAAGWGRSDQTEAAMQNIALIQQSKSTPQRLQHYQNQ